nr:hypothetical protein [Corynebacterium pyruviciproducens]
MQFCRAGLVEHGGEGDEAAAGDDFEGAGIGKDAEVGVDAVGEVGGAGGVGIVNSCLLYTSPSPRDS